MSREVKKRRRNDKTHSMEGLAKRRCVCRLPFLRLQIGLQGFGNPRFWSSVFGGPILLGGGAFCVVLGAALLVLLGGGAFCVVLGAPPSLGIRAFCQFGFASNHDKDSTSLLVVFIKTNSISSMGC